MHRNKIPVLTFYIDAITIYILQCWIKWFQLIFWIITKGKNYHLKLKQFTVLQLPVFFLLARVGQKRSQAKIEVHTLYIYWYKSQSAITNRDTFHGIDLPFSSVYLSICCSSISRAFDFLLDIGKQRSHWTLIKLVLRLAYGI